jgi:hypothetical protein
VVLGPNVTRTYICIALPAARGGNLLPRPRGEVEAPHVVEVYRLLAARVAAKDVHPAPVDACLTVVPDLLLAASRMPFNSNY